LVEEKFRKQEKLRATEEYNITIYIPADENLYLGRDVKDRGVKGYSTIAEIKDTAKEIEKDLNAGVIDRKTANARLMRLRLIVKNTKRGQLRLKKNKQKAIAEINKIRKRIGFKPVNL